MVFTIGGAPGTPKKIHITELGRFLSAYSGSVDRFEICWLSESGVILLIAAAVRTQNFAFRTFSSTCSQQAGLLLMVHYLVTIEADTVNL